MKEEELWNSPSKMPQPVLLKSPESPNWIWLEVTNASLSDIISCPWCNADVKSAFSFSGTESETQEFMSVCIKTVKKYPLEDYRSPVFIFERLCSIIYPVSRFYPLGSPSFRSCHSPIPQSLSWLLHSTLSHRITLSYSFSTNYVSF